MRLDEGEQHLLFLGAGLVEEGGVALLGAQAEMHQQGRVAAVVEDQVRRAAVAPFEDLAGVVPVLLEAFALVGEDRNAGGGDGGGGVILGRVDVARGPADVGAERRQRLDQHGRLDRHVQRAGDAGALQGLALAVLLAGGHEPRHLGLGDGDLLAAPLGETDVLHDVIGDRPMLPSMFSSVPFAGECIRRRGLSSALYSGRVADTQQDIKKSLCLEPSRVPHDKADCEQSAVLRGRK